MCGIAGILQFGQGRRIEADTLRRMCRAIAHRGPDDEGVYVGESIGLAMRRLSIIDLSTGHQPINNEDDSIWIVFNGEIYNYSSLRQDLIADGHRFRSHSDTEVIVHLYEQYGDDCVQHLRGMFAFAIWDSKRQRLFAARDRLGIKPFYYHVTPEHFLFASEIKALFAHERCRAELRPSVLPEYLAFGYLSGPETLYSAVEKLMPGHWLAITSQGDLKIEQYWDIPTGSAENGRNEAYYVNTYRDGLEDAVRSHLMSDVPLGVFLSGGLDSSAIAALVTQARKQPIDTFSVGYSEDRYSELPYAHAVSRHLHSVHHEVVVSHREFFAALPRLVWHEDEPIVWPSSVALYFVARMARQHVKVVLTGEGSDETLGGYSRYATTLLNTAIDRPYRRFVPDAVRKRVMDSVAASSLINSTVRRKLSHSFLARDGQSWISLYFDNFLCAFDEAQQHRLFHPEFAHNFQPGAAYQHVLRHWERSSGEMLHKLLYTDIKTYLVELLMKQDSMSMAASIESRVPFLDHQLVEFALQIPQQFQIAGLAGKRTLKKAMRGLVPDAVIRRKKLGFPTPWSAWLKGPLIDDIENFLLEPRTLERKLFRPDELARLFHEHKSHTCDHGERLWRLLNLELWHRVCLEGDSDTETVRDSGVPRRKCVSIPMATPSV